MFSSTINILKVDPVEVKQTKDKTSTFEIRTAQTALLNDDGSLNKVGRLRIPDALKEVVKVGIFRATFALEVAQWGQNKGDVVALLTGLVPVGAAPAPAPAPAPVAAGSKG